MPCFEGVVSRDGARSRFYDTQIQRFAVFLYHSPKQLGSDSNNWGQIPIVLLEEGTLKPPAMGTHFSGLSLKKWSPGRATLK